MERLNEEIGKRLKHARKMLKLHQHDMAEILHMQQANYSNIERGKSALHIHHFVTLHNQLAINPEYILFGRGTYYVPRTAGGQTSSLPWGLDLEDLIIMQDQAETAEAEELRSMVDQLWGELVKSRNREHHLTTELLGTYQANQALHDRIMDLREQLNDKKQQQP